MLKLLPEISNMKKGFFKLLKIVLGIYIILCATLYFFQEKLIFFPQKLAPNYTFDFRQNFEEINTITPDGKSIHGLLFKADSSKGLIFYLHGNAGSIKTWGEAAKTYTALNYDVFIPDYRGYGKSEGKITSENQLFSDNQLVYNQLKKRYSEHKMIILGYSIGTGLAAKLASTNKPRLLILQAPYYNLTDMMKHRFSFIPTFLLKYKFATNQYLKNCKMPLVIFHGNEDRVIYYASSLKLKAEFKPQDTLITLMGQGHGGITDNEEYREAIRGILGRL